MKWKYTIFIATVLLTVAANEDTEDEAIVTEEELEADLPTGVEEDIKYISPQPTVRFYFSEHFDDVAEFEKKWTKSEAMKKGIDADIAKYDGLWNVEAPERERLIGDLGLVLKSKAKHAAISAKLTRPFVFDNRPLIVQYEVTLQDGQECGGAYLKLLSADKDANNLKQFQDKTPYTIMFGPDKCGNDHKLHFIFRHKNPVNGSIEEKHCKKPKERLEEPFQDKLPHLYTLIIKPDNTYEIKLDHRVINSGSLLEDFTPSVNPPAEIDDPSDKKPEDWDEREKIPDPEAQKPEDWDEEAPAQIVDPNAVKPDGWLDDEPTLIPESSAVKPADWDNDMDGDWEAPLIPNPVCETAPGCGTWKPPVISNPAYKGKWRAPLIDNPNYKGKWRPKRIPNPEYYEDKNPFQMTSIGAVGFELWSMSQNILFDNIVITDDLASANQWAAETFDLKRLKIDQDAESFWTRLLRYTHENPWIWAVYVLVVGLPLVLVLFFCCSSGASKEKEEMKNAAQSKKTDAVTQDDPIIEEDEGNEEELADGDNEKIPKTSASKNSLEESSNSEELPTVPGEASGDAPRRRRPRKD